MTTYLLNYILFGESSISRIDELIHTKLQGLYICFDDISLSVNKWQTQKLNVVQY